MKHILKATALTALLAAGTTTAFAQTNEAAASSDDNFKVHLRMMKIVDGERAVIDTVITDKDAFFNDFAEGLNWHEAPDFRARRDSARMGRPGPKGEFRAQGRRAEFRRPGNEMVREFRFQEGDTTRQMVMIHRGQAPGGQFGGPRGNRRPMGPMLGECPLQPSSDKLIRLDDPSITTLKRKDLKDGMEKIEIIRKKPVKKEIKIELETTEEAPQSQE